MKIITLICIILFLIPAVFSGNFIFAQNIVWLESDFNSPKLVRSSIDGVELESLSLVTGLQPQGLAFNPENDSLYWGGLTFNNAGLFVCGSILGSASGIINSQSVIRGIAADTLNDQIYWTSTNLILGSAIWRAGIQGQSPTVLIQFASGSDDTPWDISLDAVGGKMYWTNYGMGKIQRADMVEEAIPEDVITGLDAPAGLDLDLESGKIFWTEVNTSQIKSADLDGNNIITLVNDPAKPYYISINTDIGKMAWTALSTGEIKLADTDGSDIQITDIAASAPRGILLESSPVSNLDNHSDIEIPEIFALHQNYPNPFNPVTVISWQLPADSYVELGIFDLLGQKICTLVSQRQKAGEHRIEWNASDVASGVYIYKLKAGSFEQIRKMVLLR
jgi:hypothetical protein